MREKFLNYCVIAFLINMKIQLIVLCIVADECAGVSLQVEDDIMDIFCSILQEVKCYLYLLTFFYVT